MIDAIWSLWQLLVGDNELPPLVLVRKYPPMKNGRLLLALIVVLVAVTVVLLVVLLAQVLT